MVHLWRLQKEKDMKAYCVFLFLFLITCVDLSLRPYGWCQDNPPEKGAASQGDSSGVEEYPAKRRISLDLLKVVKEELPVGCFFKDGIHSVSITPEAFYSDPTQDERFSEPVNKIAQSVVFEEGKPGTIMFFEYEDTPEQSLLEFLPGFLWEGAEGPTERHPEEMASFERFVIILSFEQGNPTANWFKKRMRQRFGVRFVKRWPKLTNMFRELDQAYKAKEFEKGLNILLKNKEKIQGNSYGQWMTGKLAMALDKWDLAEKAFRQAIELDFTGEDPFSGGDVELWECVDGRGISLFKQERYPEAAAILAQAREVARFLDDKSYLALAEYNFASACVQTGRFDYAMAGLKQSIEIEPKYRETALKDPNFKMAFERKEFRELLE
jgi:hypothetical protein